MTGKKYDEEKRDWWLLPKEISVVVDVLMHGAKKYGAHNWISVEDHERRYYNAAMRHMHAWAGGEESDPESGLHHLAHAICSLLFIVSRREKVK